VHLSDEVPTTDQSSNSDELHELFDPAFADDPYYSPDSGLNYEDTDANFGLF
jgi:hypothetical protein